MTGERSGAKPSVKHIDDAKWLAGVRSDLDSRAEDWAVHPDPSQAGISKLQALGSYLDTILTELGHRGRVHKCPECHLTHVGPSR